MVNICLVIYTPVFWYANILLHLPSLPLIYSPGFTFLRHISKEQVCANSFLLSSDTYMYFN